MGCNNRQGGLDQREICQRPICWVSSPSIGIYKTSVNPWLIHVNVWRKPLQYCKVISLQLIKMKQTKKDFSLE